jgi:SAM-dependent methyltransferase
MDLSFQQLATAGELAVRQKVDTRIRWVNGDVAALPLHLHPDHILFTEVMEHLLDPAATLSEVRRICSHETRLILSVPQIYGTTGMGGVLFRQILPESGETIETQDPTRLRTDLPICRFYHGQYTVDRLRDLLERSAFRLEAIQPVVFKIPLRIVQSNESRTAMLVRRGRNGLARLLYHLAITQPSHILDRQLCRLHGGMWATNLVAVCRAK